MGKFSGFLDKAKARFGDKQSDTQQQPIRKQADGPSSIQDASYADVQRYRYHHGTNIGSVFILEKWLVGSMFPDNAQGSAELAAVQGWMNKEGTDSAKSRFERFWQEYISDSDLDWLRDTAKCTTIRLPIGYFTLGPPYCEGTPFKDVSKVYENGWSAVKSVVDRCQQRGIATLIDLHGLPGGANAQEHSGTNSGKAEFWSSKSNRDSATRCLCFIAQQVKNLPGVAGIQIVNEAEYNASNMYDWYSEVLNQLSQIDASMPVYISDAWDLNQAANWTRSKNSPGVLGNPVVIDTHFYWAFSDDDKKKSPQQIISEVSGKFGALDGKDGSVIDHGAVQAVVGEYSCVLTEDSWGQSQGTPKEDLVKQFGNTQSQSYQQRAGGSFFWTYRMDWMDGGEWGFKQMTNAQSITPPASLRLSKGEIDGKISDAQYQQQDRKTQTVNAHSNYWDSNHPGTYEHQRFAQGWDVGYSDAIAFFGMRSKQGLEGADKIGMLDLWCLKRIRESGQGGPFVWEFEQGLRQGIRDFYQAVGVYESQIQS
ncbi:hypothetical protein MRB53_037869 [Persea americana]|nr:hypothetical protein MRB53_037869 [Persea americana]